MSRDSGIFGFENGIHGLNFIVEQEPLSCGLLSDVEIDDATERLKRHIDSTAKKMKKALKTRPTGFF